MYKHIIVAIDLNHGEAGRDLLRKADALLDEGGTIRVLNVVEDVPSYIAAELPQDIASRRTAEASVELGVLTGDLTGKVEIEVRHGAASAQILECADIHNADLIMIASHRPGLSDYFIGSTAARVVRHAQTSVLISR
ncbi:MAG: universal stress protein [Paracoccaceae bacterium]